MSYYMRKSNRRATVDTAIDDNWVELNAPELALATSAPAIDSFAGGRTGGHFGRMGVVLSNAVPHGISQANSLLHAQTVRRGTRTSSIFQGSNNWRVWNVERRESNRTHGAVALASGLATVFAFAPDPGSRPRTRSKWFDILPEQQVEFIEETNDYAGSSEGSTISDGSRTATTDNDHLFSPSYVSDGTPATEVSSVSPTCVRYGIPPPIQIPNTISHAGRRATSLPLPSGYVQTDPQEPSQIIMIERNAPLFESPAPFTSSTTASFGAQQREPSASVTSARSILQGLCRLFDTVDRQTSIGYASTVPSPQNTQYPRYSGDFPIPIPMEDHEWEMCNLTPATAASSWFTADPRERKLLIIGSEYDSGNFRRATTETNATLATLTTLSGVSHDVRSLTSVFKKRSFIVETLVGESFDAETILDRVKMFLGDATEGDVRAIIFTGHAARTQIDQKVAIVPPAGYHGGDPDEGLISADAWRAAVNESTQPGVIVLSIFASCMSGDLMNQPVNMKDLNTPNTTDSIVPESQAAAPAPIFITFASSRSNQSTYESVVGPSSRQSDPFRYGDHFLRAFTLAARESHILDWKGFIQSLEEKFSQLRMIGAICAAHDPDIRDSNWLETHPQTPVYSSSRSKLPNLEDVLPWGISLVEREPPTPRVVNLTEEFLAHISLCGETPEITHYTLPTPSNVVPPVVL
ncbi:hypothetical protein RSOLAG22IIIB_05830 [Rhizoctonia solani]|uniref:Peptidase C14 caspase domain-containing protein n=1 Tax=Rhizoctonia solani TaxID=456999 RepID=A0A0K6G9J9_9AGAM|nr:hypothetical protein RSOLAG22IIIB_05830 [Rhizoctonia solani]